MAAAATAGDGVANFRIVECKLLANLSCTILRGQLGVLVGQNLVGSCRSVGIYQLDLIRKLNGCKIGDIFIDRPDGLILAKIVLHLEAIISAPNLLCGVLCSKIGYIAVIAVHLRIKCFTVNGQLQRTGHKVEVCAHLVLNHRVSANGVEDVILNRGESSCNIYFNLILCNCFICYRDTCPGIMANLPHRMNKLIPIVLRCLGSVIIVRIRVIFAYINWVAVVLFSHGRIFRIRLINRAVNTAGVHQLIVIAGSIQTALDVFIVA